MAMLMCHRFCLRAQHVVETQSDADTITLGQIRFAFNHSGSAYSMTISMRQDKNNRKVHNMDRTIYCSCQSEWTCLPCFAARVIKTRRERGESDKSFLIKRNGSLMKYNTYYAAIKNILTQLGLNASNYGTHSFRAGGVT